LKHENYKFHRIKRQDYGELQYFPASIIEETDLQGMTHNDLRIFTETKSNADLAIPDDSFIKELQRAGTRDEDDSKDSTEQHKGPQVLF
jgi:hypothetical protein